jgi:hypothetical protein
MRLPERLSGIFLWLFRIACNPAGFLVNIGDSVQELDRETQRRTKAWVSMGSGVAPHRGNQYDNRIS